MVHEGGFRVERSESGALTFKRPDGKVIDSAPALTPKTRPSVHRLRELNRARGLDITHRTGVTWWDGGSMDYHTAVDELLWRRDRQM